MSNVRTESAEIRAALTQRTSHLLRVAREGAGLSTFSLAQLYGTAPATVKGYEDGALPRLDIFCGLLELCGVELCLSIRRVIPDEYGGEDSLGAAE